jgi:hypothetical protein
MGDPARRRAPRPKHESSEVDWRRIALVAASLALVVIGVALAALAANWWLRPERRNPPLAPPAAIPAPRLQSAPVFDLMALRREKDAMLNEYRWIDRERGIVRIPIERAMELVVQRSDAARPAGDKPAELAR